MLRRRVIPCLLVSDGGLVKTTGFGSPTYLGDPINAVRIFNEKEVPELVVLDEIRAGGDPAWRASDGGLRIRPDHWADCGGIDGFFMVCLQKPSRSAN